DHDDNDVGAARRSAAGARTGNGIRDAAASGNHHCRRSDAKPAFDSLHNSGCLPVSGSAAVVVRTAAHLRSRPPLLCKLCKEGNTEFPFPLGQGFKLTVGRRSTPQAPVLYSSVHNGRGDVAMPYLPELFEQAVNDHRARVALIEESKQWTFGDLSDDANRIAALLKQRVKGDTVGILLLNSQRYITALLGIWKAGKTAVPLNYLLPSTDLAFIV